MEYTISIIALTRKIRMEVPHRDEYSAIHTGDHASQNAPVGQEHEKHAQIVGAPDVRHGHRHTGDEECGDQPSIGEIVDAFGARLPLRY